ncbi:hypothetical protein CONPUDRAFT_139423 [Coniophora puteana RWD-64-598 SS2]|uniref:Uncharacterized protein n=1 Tax=Coniophora puteana (strain RWD-64-598) TaxID=741705 RepID=A0A5M3MBS8_CONPW|nr:uncharacterized protein CONPUDRAFT_139423 [Coniophora puteana RWD-64-598 SS2]EIW76688.1 hypothetical protein CONPUDRAFT_139423 [Coniophora puteana RWD-64-598 SS2]
MPGPSNLNKKKKKQGKQKVLSSKNPLGTQNSHAKASHEQDENTVPATVQCVQSNIDEGKPNKPPTELRSPLSSQQRLNTFDDQNSVGLIPPPPYIYDPGNGPRVRDTRGFLSSFFAQPPALSDPLCAEFAQEEVLQMLHTVLPEETALILWYNKSRTKGRICPSCRRLYCLGDILPDLIGEDQASRPSEPRSPYLLREQTISGLCSPMCFILASFNYPGAIKTTWGRVAEEMDETTWNLLNGPGEGHGDMGLGMLLKMTRLDDLGLGQLCLPDVDFDSQSLLEPQ